MLIVAFGHEKKVGKDTAAKFLMTYLRVKIPNSNIQSHSFAWKIKVECHELYNWAGLQGPDFYERVENQHLKDVVLPKLGKSPRAIWIDFGTLVAREVYPDTWLDYLWHNVACHVLIIRDLRFVNEATRIHHYGGLNIKVENNRVPHSSDKADDDLIGYTHWDCVLNNHGTLREFNDLIIKTAEELIIPRMENGNGSKAR